MSTTKSQLTMLNINKRIYGLMWLLLNAFCNFIDLLHWLTFSLYTLARRSHDRLRYFYASGAKIEQTILEHCKAKLTKIPKHMSIIIGPDDKYVNEELLTRIFTYALTMDISFLSIYDTRTTSGGNFLLKNIEKLHHYNLNYYVWSECVDKDKRKECKLGNGAAANGCKNNAKKVEILEVTPKHGRAQIAKVCQQLFTKFTTEDHKTNELAEILKERALLTQHIDKQLSDSVYNFPEPELCIIFNCVMSTFGMLPWQTRFTEFQLHKTGRHFDAKVFAKILCRYSRIEQRWGK